MAKIFFHDGDIPLCRPRPSWEQVLTATKVFQDWKWPEGVQQLMAGPCWDPEQKKFVAGNVSIWLGVTKECPKIELENINLGFQINVWVGEPIRIRLL